MSRTDEYINLQSERVEKYAKRYPDSPARIALRMLWVNIKYLLKSRRRSMFADNRQHIAIFLRGGLGDFIFAAKCVKALTRHLAPDTDITILGERPDMELLRTVFRHQSFVQQVLPYSNEIRYDLLLQLVRFPVVKDYVPARLAPRTLEYVQQLRHFHAENPLYVRNDFLAKSYSAMCGRTRENQADIADFLNMAATEFELEIEDNIEALASRHGFEQGRYIIFQSGAGRHFEGISNETRQWPVAYYNEVADRIRQGYPNIRIIQIGEERQPAIDRVDIDLRGKISLNDTLCILKHAPLLLSQEGGMPTARHFLKGGTSIVLFGPTDEAFFGYEENINLSARPCPFACEWVHKAWIKKCLHTGDSAACMQQLTPEKVYQHIKLILEQHYGR